MEQNKWTRWRSPVLWTTIVSNILAMCVAIGWIDVPVSEAVTGVVVVVLNLLGVLGIINNPTDKDKF